LARLGKILEVKGTRTVHSKGLAEASDKAGVFSSENKQENQVKVEIKPGSYGSVVKGSLVGIRKSRK